MPTKLGFVRVMLLPAVMLFVLPAFGFWFAGHAARSYDEKFLEAVLPQVERDASLSADDKANARAFYEAVPPSRACSTDDPELSGFRESLGDNCDDYAQFLYARRASVVAIALGLFAVLFALLSSLAAFASRTSEYVSFVLGWNVLKVVGALETLLQGALLVWLSFWMTALWTERYYVKLILIAAALAGLAAFAVIVAIFKKPPSGIDVEGELVREEDAPELWARIRTLCSQLGTTPPAHVVAGIDDNFFVTEAEVRVGEQSLSGRVLYVSLSLLRTMQRSEADAVLAHEMAHLLGGDTGHSKKLSPLIGRYVQYLVALHQGLVTRPIYYFMRAYYAVFQLAVSRANRKAEFAADAAAARVTSPLDIARSLVKVGAYASYRGRVEEAMFEHNELHGDLGISSRVASGFASYARTDALHLDLHDAVTPHPFDSHPPLAERIASAGATLSRADYEQVLLAPVESTWVDAITTAAAIEQRLWTAYEQRFQAAHDLALAYRYEPANDAERAHVEKHFPALDFEGKEPGLATHIDYRGITHGEWDAPLAFADISGASVDERMFKKYLDLKLKDGSLLKSKRSLCLSNQPQADALLDAFNRYYGRHQVMVQHRSER